MMTNTILNKSELEQIKLAKSSQSKEILETLSTSIYSVVRRCVAKSSHITTAIANKLAVDPSKNVSYVAKLNSSCTYKTYEVFEYEPCVKCSVDELKYSNTCNSCRTKRAQI